jgi:pimeloyl-ACP methyl ester carboxylesterase
MPYADITDIKIYYELHGPSDATPLVLIEGWGESLWCWFRQLPFIVNNHRILVFDNRGAGKTSKPDYPYTADMMAKDVKLLMEEIGFEKAHILGKSMGGFIAQQFAISYPEKVLSLILSMTHFSGKNHIKIPYNTLMAMFAYPTETISKEEAIAIRRSVSYSPEFLRNNRALFKLMDKWLEEVPQSEKGLANQANIGNTLDSEKDLENLITPVLILHGESDLVIPVKNAELIHDRLPNSKLVILRNAPHRIAIVRYKQFNSEILNFMSEVDNGTFKSEPNKILI